MGTIHRCGMVYTDKVVIVTAGHKGLGAGITRVFVDAGAKAMIAGRDVATGEKFAEELSRKGPGQCVFQACDVARSGEVRALVDAAVERFGRLDCLVNNAGYHPPHKPIDDFTLAELQDVWQTNFVSQFAGCQHALPHLRRTHGAIINMGSLAGQIGQEAATIYCATKGAIGAFTKALAIEETRHGVRVNAVLPGNILSESRKLAAHQQPDPDAWERWLDSHQPGGRSGTPEEVGQLCLFLASDAASYITGAEIIISSGSELGYGVKYPLSWVKE